MDVRAKGKYIRISPQKTRLVVDLIRGKQVEEALGILRFTKKRASKLVEKVLRSAMANAHEKYASSDLDQLYVKRAFVDPGPTLKRIRPAPMGRAYRVVHRLSHITIELDERSA